jgi:drug/metabolite transporter (DMT)-like permease
MSSSDQPPDRPPPPVGPPPLPRDGCLTAFMVIAGILLLLPGLCAVIFVVSFSSPHPDPVSGLLVILGLAVGAVGVFLISRAFRNPSR